MSQQLWRLDEQTKKSVLAHKREQRYIAELNRDLADFRDIFWHPHFPEQRSWAEQMIKSIEHELAEILDGRLSVPADWKG